jgi:hypothetical protein
MANSLKVAADDSRMKTTLVIRSKDFQHQAPGPPKDLGPSRFTVISHHFAAHPVQGCQTTKLRRTTSKAIVQSPKWEKVAPSEREH